MGGLLGMVLAAQPETPIERLVVNDVGPAIEPAALERIKAYVGADPTFDTWAAFGACIRAISPFGPLTDAQWEHLTHTVGRERADGRVGFVYDPASPCRSGGTGATGPLAGLGGDPLPTLLLRGAASDLLSAATAQRMCATGRPPAGRIRGRRPRADAARGRPVDAVVGFLRDQQRSGMPLA